MTMNGVSFLVFCVHCERKTSVECSLKLIVDLTIEINMVKLLFLLSNIRDLPFK